jgi:hypothetical protein
MTSLEWNITEFRRDPIKPVRYCRFYKDDAFYTYEVDEEFYDLKGDEFCKDLAKSWFNSILAEVNTKL